jgi:hypothetical protein
VIAPLLLMRDFFGTLVVKALFLAKDATPPMPLAETISTLHDFVISVQSTNIANKNGYSVEFSERVRTEWEAAKKKLSPLWIAARNKGANQPVTPHGRSDQASG